MEQGPPTRVIGYVRVSTDEQSRDGVSLAAQESRVRAYAVAKGPDLADLVVDAGQSAKSLDRPGLARALAMLDRGEADGLLVAKLDRLTRSVRDLGELLDRYFGDRAAGALLSVGDSLDTRTAAGRLVLFVLMSVAQWERETVVERTRAAVGFKRSKGELISGRVPYGWDLAPDGRALLVSNADRYAAADAREARAAGRSLRAIADDLNRGGFPSKTGRPWSASSVRSLLDAPPPVEAQAEV